MFTGRKIIIAILCCCSLILVGYRSPLVSKKSPLVKMKSFSASSLDLKEEIQCSNLMSRFKKQYQYWQGLYDGYANQIKDYSHATHQWHGVLKEFENKSISIEKGFF